MLLYKLAFDNLTKLHYKCLPLNIIRNRLLNNTEDINTKSLFKTIIQEKHTRLHSDAAYSLK